MDSNAQIIEYQNRRIDALTIEIDRLNKLNSALQEKLNPVRVVSIVDINDPAFNEPYKKISYGLHKSS